MTFLSSDSFNILSSPKMFFTKKTQDQKNMSQIILKEGTAHLACYTFLQKQNKYVTFTALSTTKNIFFT